MVRLLYAGQVASHKGVTTAVKAMAHLAELGQEQNVTLTILGSGHPDYMQQLRVLIRQCGLSGHVVLRDAVPREAMSAVLQEHDVLLFPSIYEEPLARIVQEAMAVGLVVIGTTTGGTKELLVDGENGLVFPPDDHQALAGEIARLVTNPTERQRLREAGRQTIFGHFTLDRMAWEFEEYLHERLSVPAPRVTGPGRAS